jgi:hypothetical protein
MMEALDKLANIYLELLLYDIAWLSCPWIYWTGFVMFYMVFFLCKWTFLTAPLWIPVILIRRM